MSSTSFLPHSEGFEDQDNSARHPECPDDSNSLFAASGNFQAHHFPFAEDLGQMEYTPSMEPTGFSLNPEECQYAGGNDFNHGDALSTFTNSLTPHTDCWSLSWLSLNYCLD